MSKDLKPKQRLGQGGGSRRKRLIGWAVALLALGGAGYGWYRYDQSGTVVEVKVAKARRAEFIIGVRTRGEVRSVNSIILAAPQVPDPRIVRLVESGRPVKKGDVVVEFDAAQQEQTYLEKDTTVRTVDSETVQTKASHKIVDEQDGMNLMTSQYNVERAKLDASKAEVVSEIEGAKSRIDVGISEGELEQVKTTINAHDSRRRPTSAVSRSGRTRRSAIRTAPSATCRRWCCALRIDGIVNILPNFRPPVPFGSAPPPFKEGDRAWTGAAIAEIPDLSEMRVELKLEEVDRGKLKVGQVAQGSCGCDSGQGI